MNKARSATILCLGDKGLREVAKEKIVLLMWVKLESLYMTKSLAPRLCLKQQLYSSQDNQVKNDGGSTSRFQQNYG